MATALGTNLHQGHPFTNRAYGNCFGALAPTQVSGWSDHSLPAYLLIQQLLSLQEIIIHVKTELNLPELQWSADTAPDWLLLVSDSRSSPQHTSLQPLMVTSMVTI